MPREPRSLSVLTGSGFDPATGQIADAYNRWVVYTPFATPEGTGVARRMLDCQINDFVGGKSWHPSFFQETIIQAFLRMEIVVFKIETFQHRIVPFKPLRLPKAL